MSLESLSESYKKRSESPPPTDVIEQFPNADSLNDISPDDELRLYEEVIGQVLADMKDDEARREYIRDLPPTVEPLFKTRNPNAWQNFAASVKEIDGASDQAAREIASCAYQLRASTFDSFAAYEHALRRHDIEKLNLAPLTAELAIAYNVKKRQAHIHFTPSRSIKRKRELMESGMQKLATLLATRPELSDINQITARSWIVAEHPALFTRHGFTLVEEEDVAPVERAVISRQDFLARFGTPEETPG